MASNKHHELAKLVMAQVSDLLVNYSIRQTNSFVNATGLFPKIIKFDYVGKWRLKGTTRLYLEMGLEIKADYMYFNTGYTWKNAKRKYYPTNFSRYRSDLVPYADKSIFTDSYELTLKANGQVDVDLIRHELAYYFLPYLERLNSLDDLIAYLHGHKPSREEMVNAYRHHSYFYNWLMVIYLLLVKGRNREAEFCLEKVIHTMHSVDSHTPDGHIAEGMFGLINKLQKDFALNYFYEYDEESKRIIAT